VEIHETLQTDKALGDAKILEKVQKISEVVECRISLQINAAEQHGDDFEFVFKKCPNLLADPPAGPGDQKRDDTGGGGRREDMFGNQ